MNRFLLLALLTLPVFGALGQPLPTKLYLIKTMGQGVGPFRLYTTLNPKQPITFPTKSYVLLETDADSLGVMSGLSGEETGDALYPSEALPGPVYLPLERGQTYYFHFSTVAGSPNIQVNELSQRAFQFYRGLNGIGMPARRYQLSRSSGLRQIP